MLSVIYAECHAECRNQPHYAECRYAECRGAVLHLVKRRGILILLGHYTAKLLW